MFRQVIHTENAPAAIGTYSQTILVGNTLYLSGQIGLIHTAWNWLKALRLRFVVYLTT